MTKSKIAKIFKQLVSFFILITVALLLIINIRGNAGNPTVDELNSEKWVINGPLELSPDRGRFALMYSIAENKSVHFSVPIAKFASPDLGYYNGYYVSLFAPGLSFLITPGYIIGKYFGISQIGAFAVITIFAIINFWLLRKIILSFGFDYIVANLCAMTFIFATNAFSYGVSLYQHHLSTFCVLAAIYALKRLSPFLGLSTVWFLCGLSILIDFPNFFLMFPIGLYGLIKIIKIKNETDKIQVSVNFVKILTLAYIIPPLFFLASFNQLSYGSPTKLAGTVTQVKEIDENGQPAIVVGKQISKGGSSVEETTKQERSAVNFFRTRNMQQGLYILLFSPDRGALYYSPIILVMILGFIEFYKKEKTWSVVLIAVITFNLTLYTMWGDPWGGWAFGARYLIPTYAVMTIAMAYAVEKYRKNIIFIILFIALFSYSAFINTIGGITSNANPPQVEVLQIEQLSKKQEKYTYERNLDQIVEDKTKSFVYNTYLVNKINVWNYFKLIYGTILSLFILLLTLNIFKKGAKHVQL